MGKVKRVGIRELKSKLSAYLREVREGTTLLVHDRDVCVAELRRPLSQSANPVLEAWAASGEVTLPTKPKQPLKRSAVTLPAGTWKKLLEEDRGE